MYKKLFIKGRELMAAETRTNYYMYKVPNCSILIPGMEPIILHNDNILGMTIEKDFDNDYFPIFNLKLSLPYSQYYTIIDNKTTVKFKVRLEKTTYDEISVESYTEIVFDTAFSIFTDINAAFFDKELYNQTTNLLGTVENRGNFDFYLFKDNDIKASKRIINRVVSESNMSNCIVYLLSKSGTTNVLMTPLDNRNVYRDIILPPLSVIKSISYLEKYFGFYKHGSLFFYDFNTTFFINKRAECTAYRTGEYTNVIISVFKSLSANAKTPGNFKNNKTKSYVLYATRDSIEMVTSSVIDDQLYGTNINIIDTKNNTKTNIHPNIQARNHNSNYITNNYNNEYLADMLSNTKYENDNIINIALTDVDIDCFEPNKKYIMNFEDKEINVTHSGNYRLSYTLFNFIKQGEYFSINGQAQFKKTT